MDEVGVGPDGRVLVRIDPRYFRPVEVDCLVGNYSRAQRELGWQPKATFVELAKMMVAADLEKARA
jgi:GDPmannose 4,6-dehydratase